MCAPAIGLAGSVLGSVGQFASGSAAASAQNKAAIGQYKYQLKMRRLAWQDTRQQYATKLGQYGNQLAANTEAANIAYTGQQRKLNDIYKKAAFSQQAQLVQLAQGSGKMAAAGRLGKSAERLDLDVVSQFGRNQAIAAESLFGAQNAYKTRTDSISRQLESDNNKAYEKVAVQPLPGVAPPPPTMTPGPSPLGLIAGIAGAGLSGYDTYNSLKIPTPTIPTP